MTTSEERNAADEAAFREANERIRQAERELQPPLEHVPYLCECEDTGCRETIGLPREEYERVRSDPTWFVVAAGHPTSGDVVDGRGAYDIVQKTGAAAGVAMELDPRSNER